VLLHAVLAELGLWPKRAQREPQPGRRLQLLSTLTASYFSSSRLLDAHRKKDVIHFDMKAVFIPVILLGGIS
jgi:hypothetical protein